MDQGSNHIRKGQKLQIGKLDLIIISYKLTISLSIYFQEYIQYPLDYTHNTMSWDRAC